MSNTDQQKTGACGAMACDVDVEDLEMMQLMMDEAKFASFDLLRESVKTSSFKVFVWPNEGAFIMGVFSFNSKHQQTEPMLVDMNTANMLLTLYEALDREAQIKMESAIKCSRERFVQTVAVGWGAVKHG